MAVYHQMGHHSENLLWDSRLSLYSGAILSPVNYSEADIISQVEHANRQSNFEMIFDPQLYYPRSDRGLLTSWSYFPNDVDTTDLGSEKWWRNVIDNVIDTCQRIKPTAACSPALAPNVFNTEYFSMITRLGNYFVESLESSGINPIQTLVCGLSYLSQSDKAAEIASIISRTKAETIYLIFISDIAPRRELNNTEEIKGAMRLISALESAGLSVIVGFSSSDLILWKAAGATACATGKFFNLRRFTSSRFEEPSEGGGQLPYWFEEALLAFLRESDVLRVRKAGLLSEASMANPFGIEILNRLDNCPGQAWLALGWRQYLYAFADIEKRIEENALDVNELLMKAEKLWLILEDKAILMEEMRNNGEWVRIWRRAMVEFK
jgi:hypothetical protein